ncbi:MAG: YidC/Oxa1 family membrane protein insertase [Chthonomonadales bacterium]
MRFRYASRLLVLIAAAILCVEQPPAAAQQQPQPPAPARNIATPAQGNDPALANPIFAKALKLEQEGKKEQALTEWVSIARAHRNDPELAAEALYQAGLYAWRRFGTSYADKIRGQDQAVQLWKELDLEYPDTQAYRKLTAPLPGFPTGQLGQLEHEIDQRNSHDWKYQILNGLVVLTGRNPNYSYALALILLAVLVKLLLLPLTRKQYASMREMQRLQPLMKELQKKYKGAELNEKMMQLYKEHGVNPLAGCLPTLLQLPFLFLVFAAIREYELAFLKGKFLWIGSSLAQHGWRVFGYNVIGRNLADPDVPLLAIYAFSNYVTMKLTPAQDPQQQQQQNMMAVMMSGFFFVMFLSYRWSSAFVLYWLALNAISIWQQYEYVYKPHKLRAQEVGLSGAGASSGNGAGSPPAAQSSPVATAATPAAPTRVRPRKKKR